MRGKNINKNKTIENINIRNDSISNEIKLLRRNLDNNTHEVYEDLNIKKITSWRKSQNKFMKNLIFNILSFGILHLISLIFPRLYIKLYCNPRPVKECDYFLVENIYGKAILCPVKRRKDKIIANKFSIINNKGLIDDNNINTDYNNNIKNLKFYFQYKSIAYEYDENKNVIIPMYMDLSQMTNQEIINYFSEGLSTKQIIENFTERYGKNEYNLNIRLYLIFFLKRQIPTYVIILLIEFIEYVLLNNYANFLFKCIIIGILLAGQIYYMKKNFNIYKNEYSLDGNQKKLKVKRKYLLKEENQLFNIINNIDLLPGDIIFLKENDFVPCDGLIIEGECFISQSDLTGDLNISKKISLKGDSNYFNYKYSNNCILYHGMKIMNVFSKNNQGFLTVLCINTGVNTMKANQFSNILYLMSKDKGSSFYYNLFNERKRIYFFMVTSFLMCAGLGYFFKSFLSNKERKNFKKYLVKYIVGMLCKSLMTYYFLAKNIIIFINALFFEKDNIICFDQSRIINLGKINKIIFNKTETLSNNSLKIKGYHPVSIASKKKEQMKLLTFTKEQSKELNVILFENYQNYLKNKQNNQTLLNSKNKNKIKESIYLNNNIINNFNNKSEDQLTLFLECLLTCNNIENNNFELFGNKLEIKLFEDFKWNIKQYDESNNNDDIKNKFFNDNYFEIKNNYYKCKMNYYIINKVIDIFPDNYYKLTETSNYNLNMTMNNTSNISSLDSSNNIQLDVSSATDFITYKLRIYKKFIFNESLFSASIVYNLLTKELRFMIKGIPEEIIKYCDKKTIPNDLENLISIYRKNGLIILVYATKLLDISIYENNNDDLEYYMEELTFCGLLTLENEVKSHLKNSIAEIKKFNDSLIIVSGDNEYNCLSIGCISGILEDKNLFVLDTDKINNKITIQKILSIHNSNKAGSESDISKFTINEPISRVGTFLNKSNSQIKSNIYNKNIISKTNEKKIDENINENNLYIPELSNKKSKQNSILNKRMKLQQRLKEMNNENSEFERIIKRKRNDDTLYKENLRNELINDNTKDNTKTVKNSENLSKNIHNTQNQSQHSSEKKYLIFMEKYYYQNEFNEYEDVKNGIFLVSGNLLYFLYKNKERIGAKKFLDKIFEKSKIFFNMSSIDKRLLVDYLRENKDNIICTIGQCENDIDSIISSDIGISLKSPTNQNTILSHFYSSKNDIMCIKKIMERGRLLNENIIILEFISFLYAIIIDSFIFCSLLRDYDIINEELDFLEIEFFLLITSSFLGKYNKENIYKNQNSKIVTIYYSIIFSELFFIKLLSLYLFVFFFTGDRTLPRVVLNKEYITSYFVLCLEFILSLIIIFNISSFYKVNPFKNRILIIISLFYLTYIMILLVLCSSNFSFDIFNITYFTHNDNLMDSYRDMNNEYMMLSVFVDIFGSSILLTITNLLFKICKK